MVCLASQSGQILGAEYKQCTYQQCESQQDDRLEGGTKGPGRLESQLAQASVQDEGQRIS